MNAQTFLKNLNNLLNQGKFKKVGSLIENLVPTEFTDSEIKQTLNLLRKKRQFRNMEKAAYVFIANDFQLPLIRRQLAQSLIDQDRISQAIAVLDTVDKKTSLEDQEKPEILGLLGRAQKQLFVKSKQPEYLHRAIAAYKQGWDARKGDYRWHGINLIALQKRGVRDNIDQVDNSQSDDIARLILEEINTQEHLQVWDYGTAMEASLALNNNQDTLSWAKKYVRHPEADAFELGSSLRQLREIWQIKDNNIVNALEPVFEYEILQRKGGAVSVTPDDISDTSGFEAVYGNESFTHIRWLENMFKRLKSVARVFDKNSGQPYGTGFLIKASDLNSDWGNELVFVTNAHVVSDQPSDQAPLHPNLASAEFTQLPERPKIDFGKKRFYSPRYLLDVWICDITPSDELAALDVSLYPPLIADKGDKPQRVYVMGHPNGGDLVVSLYNNDLVGYQLPYVHYTSPTEGGSSGSPVLTRDLLTFALHHKTKPDLQANEGILLDQIREQCSGQVKQDTFT